MQGPYLIDLRKRVVSAHTADMICREVARMFNVLDSSVVRWTRQYKRERRTDSERLLPYQLDTLSSAFRLLAAYCRAAESSAESDGLRGRDRSTGLQRSNRQPLLGILKSWVAWTIFAPQMLHHRTRRARGIITALTVGN